MGFSSSKTKVEPWGPARAPILAASGALSNAYNTNAGRIQGYADTIGGLIPGMVQRYNDGDPSVNAAQDWATRILGNGGSNPELQGMIDMAGTDTARSINANLGTRGLTGGSVQQRILAEQLSKQALGLRYSDWQAGQQRQAQAAGLAPSLAAADNMQIQPLLASAAAASGLPLDAASQYASGTGNLLGQYTTTRQSQPWGTVLAQAAANAGAALISDARLKEDIALIGQTHAGLPIYTFKYKGNDTVQMGVMAQDVAQAQPDALGPMVDGFHTVYYGKVI